MHSHQHMATLQAARSYKRLNINNTSGLTTAQQAALRALGAMSEEDATPLVV